MIVAPVLKMGGVLPSTVLVIIEKVVGALFCRADCVRSDRTLRHADTERHRSLVAGLVNVRAIGENCDEMLRELIGFPRRNSFAARSH